MDGILRVGTDCSGIEAPIQALRQLGIPHRHVFSSEIDKFCIKSIKANYDPEILFGDPDGPFKEGDITKRNIEDVPEMDLYVCGFPCQPFSDAGNKLGIRDARGTVFEACADLIRVRQPKMFVLENVAALLNKRNRNAWNTIRHAVTSIPGYTIKYTVLNTADYGLPQERRRLYIVGSRQAFQWPPPVNKERPSVIDLVDHSDTTQESWPRCIPLPILQKGAAFIDMDFLGHRNGRPQPYPRAHILCSCVVARASLWCVPHHRKANVHEYLALQGFSSDFSIVVSPFQLKKQVGNSMSVGVLIAIFSALT